MMFDPLDWRGSLSGPSSGLRLLKKPHCRKRNQHHCFGLNCVYGAHVMCTMKDAHMEEFCHLIEAVCDECEEKTASKSRKQPHPPRDPHLVEYGGKCDSGGSTDLARLAGYHRGRHRVGLEGKVLLRHKERQPGHPRNQLRRDLHLLCVVLHLGLCEQTRPDFKEHTLVLLERSDSALDHSAARPAACKLRLKLSDGSPTPCS